jgi:hypothetical protein
MTEFDFHPYLEFARSHYAQSQGFYTPTDAILPLKVQSVERQDPNSEDRPSEQKVEQFPVLDGLRRYALGEKREHVLLAGRPGSGKSMALRQLVVSLTGEGQIPVLVQLKGDRTVPELIKAEFRRAKVAVTEPQIDEWLMRDQLILLLDGVNEMPSEELRRSLAQFREDNRTVPMIFTTRDLSLGGDLGIGKRLEMKPLSERQLREFVGKYLPEQGEKLLGQLRDRLREIAETPLLLKMLCDVFGQTGEIPPNKGELFRLFDREYERFKSLPAVSADFRRFKSEILQHLAFVMMQGDASKPTEFWLTIERSQAERSIEQWLAGRVSDPAGKAKEWLEDLLEHHLLQVAADGRRVEFHHQLFQEYYAAEWLLGRVRGMDDKTLECEFLNLLKWTETVGLMLGLVEDEGLAVRVVERALEVDLMLGAKLAQWKPLPLNRIKSPKLDEIDSPQCFWIGLIESLKTDNDFPIDTISSDDFINNAINILRQPDTQKNTEKQIRHLEKILDYLDQFDITTNKLADIDFEVSNLPFSRNISCLTLRLCILANIRQDKYIVRLGAWIKRLHAKGKFQGFYKHVVLLSFLKSTHKASENYIEEFLFELTDDQLIISIAIAITSNKWKGEIHSALAIRLLVTLKKLCQSPDLIFASSDYITLTESLGWSNHNEIITTLRKIAFGENVYLPFRISAITAMGISKNDVYRSGLEKLLAEGNSKLHEYLIDSIASISGEGSIKLLHKILDLPYGGNSKIRAAHWLIRFGEFNSMIRDILISQIESAFVESCETEEGFTYHNVFYHSEFSWDAAEALSNCKEESLIEVCSTVLPFLYQICCQPSKGLEHLPYIKPALYVIETIQKRCKFYNYEIFHSPPAKPQPTQPDTLATIVTTVDMIDKRTKQMADQPARIFNLHDKAQYFEKVEGGYHEHNYAPQANLKETEQLTQLLQKLRTSNPNATEEQIFDILLRGFQTMPQNNPQNWQSWQNILGLIFVGGVEGIKIVCPPAGIPIEVGRKLYDIYDRNRKQLPGA